MAFKSTSLKRLLIAFGIGCGVSALGTSLFLWYRRKNREITPLVRLQSFSEMSTASGDSVLSASTSFPGSEASFSDFVGSPSSVTSSLTSISSDSTYFENTPLTPCVVKPFDCANPLACCLTAPKERKKKTKKRSSGESGDSKKEKPIKLTNVISCDCRNRNTDELPSDDTGSFDSDWDFDADLNIPNIHPIAFERFVPSDLTVPPAEGERQKRSSPESDPRAQEADHAEHPDALPPDPQCDSLRASTRAAPP
ncbi:hypothetical protein L596_019312 [Steinernema carpocapsae]|uniref:Uncharacterized protein n=1 Tax=Steinernema carpocapsae TaxID=34508 RepID=A0A4U5MQ38_STECR|nr:hypothetical protein L596_019312 [Steinernema carpocapsae]